MLTEDEIRRAVELAGWHIDTMIAVTADQSVFVRLPVNSSIITLRRTCCNAKQPYLDALAAALVRMVDNLEGYFVETDPTRTRIYGAYGKNEAQGPDRTENTTRAVLELTEKHPEVFE